MGNPTSDDRAMLTALTDMGMEPMKIQQFMDSFRLGQSDKCKRLLSSHRSKLLSDVHVKQDKLFCMDVFIRTLNLNNDEE